MKNELMSKVFEGTAKIAFTVKKHSPEILAAVGIIGVVASGVMACKATLKAKDVLDETKEKLDAVKESAEEKPEEETQKATTAVYAKAGLEMVKLYGPAVMTGAASIGCLLASNGILKKRNGALAAAYMTLDQSFKGYRDRVVDRFGKEVEKQIRHNIKPVEVEETNEKGKTTKKTIDVVDISEPSSDYVKYFKRGNPNWCESKSNIMTFLNLAQTDMNDRLKSFGYYTLNEAYRYLGFEETKAGMVVGWVYDPKNPKGDNFIQLDVTEVYIQNEFGGYEEAYAVDFNVDGNIYKNM